MAYYLLTIAVTDNAFVSTPSSHYLTLPHDAVHRIAGWGPNWSSSHSLGRNVKIPEGALELVLPSLNQLVQQLQISHKDHPLLPALLTSQWLVEVWLQV